MKLKHPFKSEVRLLYLGHWECFLCGCNGWDRGGLEIHHILGRISGSAFNSSCLCGYCHKNIGHSLEEQHKIFFQTFQFIRKIKYKPSEADWEFLEKHYKELVGSNTEKLLKL